MMTSSAKMSLNDSHANGGVLIYAGERILIFYDGIDLTLTNPSVPAFSGKKSGRVYLTSHRLIFNNLKHNDLLQSFSIPFRCMRDVKLEQPIFGANYIGGYVVAEEAGKWQGQAKFEVRFMKGGAIEFGKAMLIAGQKASKNRHRPPPYAPPPPGPYYAAQPPAYSYAVNDPTYAFVPYQTFPEQPPPNSVYMMEAPPPYPGIDPNPPPYNPNHYGAGATAPPMGGYPPAGPPPQPGFVVTNGMPNGNDAKAQEAAQSSNAYYNPQQPHNVYMPASAPPSYDDAVKKTQ